MSDNGKLVKSLSEGLAAFDRTEAAPEFAPLPPGIYIARVVRGEFTTTKSGADAYRMAFEIVEGDHVGRTVFRTWTFTPKALPYTKRDLVVFGLNTSEKLLSPFPEPGREYRVRIVIALQRGDDGTERNDVKRIDVIRITESPIAQFVVLPTNEGGAQ